MPVGAVLPRRRSLGAEIFHSLKSVLKKKGYNTAVGDEGGFAPNLKVQRRGDRSHHGGDQEGGLSSRPRRTSPSPWTGDQRDVLQDEEVRVLQASDPNKKRSISATDGRVTGRWVEQYPIISIEDGLDENDWEGLEADLTDEIGDRSSSSGTTSSSPTPRASSEGIEKGVANSILIKVNQIGTLTETLNAIEMARKRRVHRRRQPPLGRNRGHDDRRHRRGDQRRPDQNGIAQPHRSHSQIQPTHPHRGRVGGLGAIPRRRNR